MPEPCTSRLPELFGTLQDATLDLLKLRLAVLPQPKFIMLLERTEELRQSLNMIVARKINVKRLQKNNEMTDGDAQTARVLSAIAHVLKLLDTLREGITADLRTAEEFVHFGEYFPSLLAHKQHLRSLSSSIERDSNTFLREDSLLRHNIDLNNITKVLGEVKDKVLNLCAWSGHKIARYCKSIEKIFYLLKSNRDLSGVNTEVLLILQEIAYSHVEGSKFFDSEFYLAQLSYYDLSVGNGIRHYFRQDSDFSPCQFFKNSYYIALYPEVSQLQYNALEHYVRYGELLRYNPGPDFDTLYYLENNDDILDANISPLRHFVLHGQQEGRQPSPSAGRFFAMRYLSNTAISLAFVGEPDEAVRSDWELLRSHVEGREYGRVVHIPLDSWTGSEKGLDAVVVGEDGAARLHGELLRELARSGCRIIYLGTHPHKDIVGLLRQDQLPLERVCAITTNYESFIRWQESGSPLKLHYYVFEDSDKAIPFVESLMESLGSGDAWSLRRVSQGSEDEPCISVVSIIYKKIKEMLAFLEALNRQDLARPYEVVLVDDASPDNTVELVVRWLDEMRQNGLLNKFMTVRILRNAVNSGNCSSRNRGVEAAGADVVLVVDGDVVLSTSSLSEHVWAYRFGDCDAVIGFFKFNLDYDFVFHWLAACEVNPNIARQHILRASEFTSEKLNMRSLPNSIFNFVTRNTSFRKSAFGGQYFDEEFNYSSDKNSGYGEEDHELSARLYFEKKRIRFIESSISVHIRHFDNSYSADKVLANLRNWNRLIDKHPDLMLVDRPYYQWRTCNLLGKAADRPDAPEVKIAQARYLDPSRAKVTIPPTRPLKILTYKWHMPSQYELFKLQHMFTLVADIGATQGDTWDYGVRPLPYNARFAPLKDIDPNDYDFAILPFDERLLFSKGRAFEAMLEVTKDLPRFASYNETPLLYGKDDQDNEYDLDILAKREVVRTLLQEIHVVCDSYQAQREWNFAKSSVIWPGFSPQEFPAGTHEKACVTFSRDSLEGLSSRSGAKVLGRIEALLSGECTIEYMAPPFIHPGYEANTQEWAVANFQNYAAYLGTFKMYLNPFKRAYLPRTNGEAMCAGVIPMALRNHDVEMFIKNGFNGFCGDSVEELVEHMFWLLRNERRQQKISDNARRTALDIFNIDRHLSGWTHLIHKLL